MKFLRYDVSIDGSTDLGHIAPGASMDLLNVEGTFYARTSFC